MARRTGRGAFDLELLGEGERLDLVEGEDGVSGTAAPATGGGAGPGPRPAAGWKQCLAGVQALMEREDAGLPEGWRPGREVLYVLDVAATLQQGLTVDLVYRDRKVGGSWTKLRSLGVSRYRLGALPDPADRQVMALLAGARDPYGGWSSYSPYEPTTHRYQLPVLLQVPAVSEMCRTGRCRLRRSREDEALSVLTWDAAGPWEFWLQVQRHPSTDHYVVTGALRRGDEREDLSVPVLLVAGSLAVFPDRVAPLDDGGAFPWIAQLRERGPLVVPAKHRDALLEGILRSPRAPRLDLPEELRVEEVLVDPRPRLHVRSAAWGRDRLRGDLSFDYDGVTVPARSSGRGVFQASRRRFLLRDAPAERAAAERLARLGFRPHRQYPGYGPPELGLSARHLPRVVPELTREGWHVEAEGRLYRHAGAIRLEVSSGVDWFELHGGVSFGAETAAFPALLAALRRGENTVRLGDGSYGLLPEVWLRKYAGLATLGTARDGHLRFTRTQVGVLDALLAAHPEATCDAVFARARHELRQFEGVEPLDPPAGFAGRLRGYQKDGLGWFQFLRQFGFGGCLADDMGLGKTVQVLALLEARRQRREAAPEGDAARPGRSLASRPSLVVVPRSLVFNWKAEAARFTPGLRVLDHSGVGRGRAGAHFDGYDLVLTTYGTLRRDAVHFKDVHFDYVILDEAQAIKNAGTESAKAARLLRGDHRLALSGTPVQNHLGELWSLFEFLNPGMLGAASAFGLDAAATRDPAPETRALLARALRPFVLRRTKEQVAPELPRKLEQTLHCELEPAQRAAYDELRAHYRHALLGRVARDGIRRSAIQILEALLRLRQAACHPGLIDRARAGEPSAKLDVLLPQLAQVREEGHKALVFSQFTSFLAIVRARLDREGTVYEYLDGRTRDRAARVERFQADPDCQLFLVSLKAGGLGLNLTAAEYVFLLDPWWNPAVEAQAIDRTHRIGQTRPVFAYRLIARDTVEEKVLELQETKRGLADAIINADNSLLRTLTRDDLELLLS